MENKAHALAAGIFVAVLTALLLGLGAWLTRDTGIRDTYEISTRETVTGLQEQAPVRYRGVDVGKVSRIGFDPAAIGSVLITLQIDRETPLTQSTFATLAYQGVTGLSFIQLDDDGKSTVRLKPDTARPPRIPLRPGLLARLEERGEVLLNQVEQVATRVNRLLDDGNQKRIALAIDNIGQAADSTSQLAKRLDQTVQQRLDPALAAAGTTLTSVRQSADAVAKTAHSFDQTAQRLNAPDGPIDQLAEGTQALSHAADSFNNATLPRLNRLTEEGSRSVRALGRTVNGISENPQSLIFGAGTTRPGPGEPGFQAPTAGSR